MTTKVMAVMAVMVVMVDMAVIENKEVDSVVEEAFLEDQVPEQEMASIPGPRKSQMLVQASPYSCSLTITKSLLKHRMSFTCIGSTGAQTSPKKNTSSRQSRVSRNHFSLQLEITCDATIISLHCRARPKSK